MTPRFACACCIVLAWVLLCAWAWGRHRARHAAGAVDGDGVLVVHASQTGLAAELAESTAGVLRAGGVPARVASMDRVDAASLGACTRALFVASTYGEGDPPDAAADFAATVMTRPVDLGGLRYAVLALGDRGYAHFCGFGRRLAAWLPSTGATPLFDTIEVDRGDAAALQRWHLQLASLTGQAPAPASALPARPAHAPWRLVERTQINAGSTGAPCYHVALAPDGPGAQWQAGDIAEIALPAPGGARETRDYSIASLPADGAIHLLVRQRRDADGTLGRGSAWLTVDAPVGATLQLRVRANPNFHGPADDRPMILVGSGTGIAGLRAHLKARAAAGHRRNWLLFGERHAAHDRPYDDDIRAWQRRGIIERLDRVYSRDAAARRHVQHALRDAAQAVRDWIAAGAAVYVCGSASGMGADVDRALREILGDAAVRRLAREGRYRRDVY